MCFFHIGYFFSHCPHKRKGEGGGRGVREHDRPVETSVGEHAAVLQLVMILANELP